MKTTKPARYDWNQILYEYAVEETNRFKGLDLVNRAPEELLTETHTIVQEAVNKTIPEKMKSKMAKRLSEEALQIAEERKAAKSKGERERHIRLNSEFQRIARRDKKAFFNKQCIKLEENSKRGKTIDISSEKNGNIKEIFHQKLGTIKDKNDSDLVDAKEIRKRCNTWKKYMEELYKKDLNEPDYYDGVVSHPEPDIPEC